MLIDNPCIERWLPNEGVRERTEGAEGGCNPIGRITTATNQYPWNSYRLNNQRVHKARTMTPIAYEADDGLIGHQREDLPFVL